jgi:hypothetical protein
VTTRFDQFPKTGDIALMNAKPGIIAAQSALRGRTAHFSHAALVIDDEAYVDSLTTRGVGVARWIDLDPKMPIAVYRHRPSSMNAHVRLHAMIEHYGRAYNFVLAAKNHPAMRGRFENALYCSEFVAKVYTREELGIPRNKRLILPTDLEKLAASPDWDDVTELYEPLIAGTARPPPKDNRFSNAELFRKQGELRRLVEQETHAVHKIMQQLDELQELLRRGFQE